MLAAPRRSRGHGPQGNGRLAAPRRRGGLNKGAFFWPRLQLAEEARRQSFSAAPGLPLAHGGLGGVVGPGARYIPAPRRQRHGFQQSWKHELPLAVASLRSAALLAKNAINPQIAY